MPLFPLQVQDTSALATSARRAFPHEETKGEAVPCEIQKPIGAMRLQSQGSIVGIEPEHVPVPGFAKPKGSGREGSHESRGARSEDGCSQGKTSQRDGSTGGVQSCRHVATKGDESEKVGMEATKGDESQKVAPSKRWSEGSGARQVELEAHQGVMNMISGLVSQPRIANFSRDQLTELARQCEPSDMIAYCDKKYEMLLSEFIEHIRER